MKSRLPIKKLVVFNLWLTAYFFLLGLVTSMARSGPDSFWESLSEATTGAILLCINTFVNLGILLVFERRAHGVIPKLKFKYLLISYGLNILAYVMVVFGLSLVNHKPFHYERFIVVALMCILINTLIMVLQRFVVIQDKKMLTDVENSKLKAANSDAINQLLRQQIHPHFLFNALNILKSLYKVNPAQGETYLIRLSDFLRAAVSHNNSKITSLQEEVKLCVDYLEMQKIRFGKAFSYAVSISEEVLAAGRVPSFSIQPLVENAIKHNELTEESPLHISIEQQNDFIVISNNRKPKSSNETSTGSGLANLSERYRLLSGDEVMIEENDRTFSVRLKILANEHYHH